MSDDKPITINQFFKLVDKLGKKALKDEWGFYPRTDIYSHPEYVAPVAITYCIDDRTYARDITARKPTFKERDEENRQIINGQMFDVIVEFGIWGKDYDEVNNTREWLEKFLYRQLKTFKKEGIIKLLFEGQLRDRVEEINDNHFTEQRLHYHVRNSREVRVPYSLIENIDLKVNNFSNIENIRENKDYY